MEDHALPIANEPLDPGAEPGASVLVFAPAPLLTVTIEHGRRGEELHLHAGGQGFWVARMVRRLGVPVTMCSPFGGETGRVLRLLVEAEGVAVKGVEVQAASGSYVHDRRDGSRRIISHIPGEPLGRHDMDNLYDAALVAGLQAGVAVLTGQFGSHVVPVEMFRRLAVDLRSNGCLVVADLSAAELRAALRGGIDVLKVSHEELLRDGFVPSEEVDDIVDAMYWLRDAGAGVVVVTRAGEPALALADGRLLEIDVPRLEAVDYRGAGDSLTAGLATGLARRLPVEDALREAAAAGSLNVTRHGLGTGSRSDVQGLARLVDVREVGRVRGS